MEAENNVGLDEVQTQYNNEKLMTEFIKMFAIGVITGKSLPHTFKYNIDNMTKYINGIEFIISSFNEVDYPQMVLVKNYALMVVVAKSISQGFNPDRYPDIIREYVDIKTLSEYDVDNSLASISIMLADIVMGNKTIVSQDIANKYATYTTLFIGLYENYLTYISTDIILAHNK